MATIDGDLWKIKNKAPFTELDETYEPSTDSLEAIRDAIGAFTVTENLKAILGDLSTTKRLGQILGALDETDTLKAILGGYTAAAPLKTDVDAISSQKIELNEITIYPAAEDLATAELTGAGTTRYLAESSQTNADEPTAEGAPAWQEDYDLEQAGTLSVISIYADLRWAQKLTGTGTSYVKMQISGDGGSTWTDMSDNVTEGGTGYVDKQRTGPGLWYSVFSAGANQLKLRLCQWTDADSTEVKLREDSQIKITYRKS